MNDIQDCTWYVAGGLYFLFPTVREQAPKLPNRRLKKRL